MPFPTITPTIPELLHSATERFGDRTFLIADEEVTYAEMDARSKDLAKSLLLAGVTKGSHVGIWMPNVAAWAESWFALARIGAVVIPLNTFLRPPEFAWTARHADLSMVMMYPSFRTNDYLAGLEAAFPDLAGQDGANGLWITGAPFLRTVTTWGPSDRSWTTPGGDALTAGAHHIDDQFLGEVERCVSPGDSLTIIYTSGSTGRPKGTVHTHGALVRHSYNLTHLYPVHSDDVLFTSMPFFWVGGLITGLHAVIHHGATLVTQPAFDAEGALDLIEHHRATITLGWPQQGETLASHPSFTGRDLSSIRRTSMPAMVPPERRPPSSGAGSLGMTELCGNHLGADPYEAQPPSRAGTFGPSIEGLEHRIVDPETGIERPTGQEGEIWARGYSLMQALYKQEREETFTRDGFYRTGDAGSMDEDGWVTFRGRLGDMIKTSGGTNVTPGEVEEALRACTGVVEAYVTGLPDSGGGEQVVAAVVVRTGSDVSENSLRSEVRGKLSAYKVPRVLWIADKAELPFTDTGKIVKAKLATLIGSRRSAD